MRAGTPIIASSVGGIPDILNNGDVGLLVEPGDPNQLANTIEHLLSSSSLRQRLSVAARKRLEDNYSSKRMSDRYIALYERLAAQHRVN